MVSTTIKMGLVTLVTTLVRLPMIYDYFEAGLHLITGSGIDDGDISLWEQGFNQDKSGFKPQACWDNGVSWDEMSLNQQ